MLILCGVMVVLCCCYSGVMAMGVTIIHDTEEVTESGVIVV